MANTNNPLRSSDVAYDEDLQDWLSIRYIRWLDEIASTFNDQKRAKLAMRDAVRNLRDIEAIEHKPVVSQTGVETEHPSALN